MGIFNKPKFEAVKFTDEVDVKNDDDSDFEHMVLKDATSSERDFWDKAYLAALPSFIHVFRGICEAKRWATRSLLQRRDVFPHLFAADNETPPQDNSDT
jgi:hypothetical protein